MGTVVDLGSLLSGLGEDDAGRLTVFAVLNLGMIESLASGSLDPEGAVAMFFHARNCLFVRATLGNRVADEVMGRGVQLADLFDALPTDEARAELGREFGLMKSLCLELLDGGRVAA